MNIILYDAPQVREEFLPLTFTRPLGELRHGILTIAEKWKLRLNATISFKTQDYLSSKFPTHETGTKDVYIPGNMEPTERLLREIKPGAYIKDDGAGLQHVWELFSTNDTAIKEDFSLLTHGRESLPLSPTNRVIGDPSLIFLEPGARVECSNLNTTDGPIYIGRNAEVMEGCSLRGPVALCEGAVLKMGAKVYGATTLGPYCKCGGELANVVLQGYSNKAHDGFLGNAVIGEWCNLGAGCTASNLKNNYAKIRLWNYRSRRFERTDLQFCGLIMGDHSCAGINTMFNTATVVGVGVNFYGAGFPKPYLPSFMQGSPQDMTSVILSRLFETCRTMMARRHVEFTPQDQEILQYLYNNNDNV